MVILLLCLYCLCTYAITGLGGSIFGMMCTVIFDNSSISLVFSIPHTGEGASLLEGESRSIRLNAANFMFCFLWVH